MHCCTHPMCDKRAAQQCVNFGHQQPSPIWAEKTEYSCICDGETHVCLVLQRFQIRLWLSTQGQQLLCQVKVSCLRLFSGDLLHAGWKGTAGDDARNFAHDWKEWLQHLSFS